MASKALVKLLTRAEEAMNRRNYELAIFNYIQAITLEPNNLDARLKLRVAQAKSGGSGFMKFLTARIKAQMSSMLGKHEQCIIACENALAAKPENIGLMKLIATAASNLNGEAEGTRDLRTLAAWQLQMIVDKYDPEDTGVLWQLAEIYEDIKEPGRAIECYEAIREIDPDADVGPAIRNQQAQVTSKTFQEGVEKGARAIQQDEEAGEQYERETGKMRDDESRMKTINYLLENDCQARPDDHKLWARIGEIYFDFDNWTEGYAEAKKYLAKAHELNPSDNTVLDKLGDLEIKRFRTELEPLKEKAQANRDDKATRKAYSAVNKKRIDYEVAEFERRVKAQPLKSDFHHRLGDLYFTCKRFDDAVGELQQAARDPKIKLRALTTLGRCFQGNGQIDMAITQFQKAREGQEMFQRIRDPLYYEALAHEEKGDAEKNMDELTQAVDLYKQIYEVDINFRNVKKKVPELQAKIKALGLAG